jgi:hypothetical protein
MLTRKEGGEPLSNGLQHRVPVIVP